MPSLISGTIIRFTCYIQGKGNFTKERCKLICHYFFQFIGFCILLYYVLQLPLLLLRLLFKILSIIFSFPLKTIELILPKTDNYYILLPLFSLCLIVSYSFAKLLRDKLKKEYIFILIFTMLLSLQSIFILLPIVTSIQDQRKSSPTPINVRETIMRLSEMAEYENNKRVKLLSANNEVTKNSSEKLIMNYKNKSSTSSVKEKIGSDIEDEQKISSNEEQNLLINQQEISLVDSSQQFSSKVLENVSKFIPENTSQTYKTKAMNKSILFLQTIFDFLRTFSRSKKHLPDSNISSIYPAFTDLNCYDYRKSIDRYKQNYIYFLNIYRLRSPFPIYLSIIQSNGPQCYPNHPKSSCAIHSKKQSFRFTRFSMIIIISIIIILFIIYNRRRSNPPKKIINKKVDLPSPQSISSNKCPLDKKIEGELLLWLEKEQNDGYQNISESCRLALNTTYSKQSERLTIETLQFANAKISNASQTSAEMIVINATLDIDHLILNVIKDQQHFSIRISKLTGELEILLINNILKIKFKRIQTDNTIIIDSNNILSFEEKESIIKLFELIMIQTIVQCSFYLSDNQEKTQPSVPVVASQSSNIPQLSEAPLATPMNNNMINNKNNNQQKPPEKQVKNLLVRIVKAVRLHDVEQPFCILELNQPQQIHQTTIAKNGVNPFWDERFLFECNEKSNQINLKIIDRRKSHKKNHSNNTDILYADISIPFSYVTSTIYKQDVRITPLYPDSIIRIEFSTLTDEEALIANDGCGSETPTDSPTASNTDQETNQIQHDRRQSPSDEVITLTSHTDTSSKDNNTRHCPSLRSQATANDTLSTLSPLNSPDHDIRPNKLRKSRSFMNSFRIFHRRKNYERKGKQNENGLTSPSNISTQTNTYVSHSISEEPFVSLNSADLPTFKRRTSITRSFRNFFRPHIKKKNSNIDSNFIIDHPDLLSTSTPTPKKRSIFRRFKSKPKQEINFSTNSLTSDDCTRSESVRNTPIRANVGRPVTMTK